MYDDTQLLLVKFEFGGLYLGVRVLFRILYPSYTIGLPV